MTIPLEQEKHLEHYERALKEVGEARERASAAARDLDFHALLPIGTCAQLTGANWDDFGMLGNLVTIEGHDDEGPRFDNYVIYSNVDGDYAAVPHEHPEEDE